MKLNSSLIIVALKLRGSSRVKQTIQYTFMLLNLKKQYNATVLENNSSSLGMLEAVKDYATWGEASRETLIRLFSLQSPKVFDSSGPKHSRRKQAFKSVEELVDNLIKGKVSLASLKKTGLKTTFTLHPAKGGFRKGLKRPFTTGGELGYRGEKINELIVRLS